MSQYKVLMPEADQILIKEIMDISSAFILNAPVVVRGSGIVGIQLIAKEIQRQGFKPTMDRIIMFLVAALGMVSNENILEQELNRPAMNADELIQEMKARYEVA